MTHSTRGREDQDTLIRRGKIATMNSRAQARALSQLSKNHREEYLTLLGEEKAKARRELGLDE